MKVVSLLFVLAFGAYANAFEFTNCGEEIRSTKLKAAVEEGFARIDRLETAYTFGLKVSEKREPKICEWVKSREQITVGTVVKAEAWSEEGESGLLMSECFLTLERIDGEWSPTYLACEEFGIEDEF